MRSNMPSKANHRSLQAATLGFSGPCIVIRRAYDARPSTNTKNRGPPCCLQRCASPDSDHVSRILIGSPYNSCTKHAAVAVVDTSLTDLRCTPESSTRISDRPGLPGLNSHKTSPLPLDRTTSSSDFLWLVDTVSSSRHHGLSYPDRRSDGHSHRVGCVFNVDERKSGTTARRCV